MPIFTPRLRSQWERVDSKLVRSFGVFAGVLLLLGLAACGDSKEEKKAAVPKAVEPVVSISPWHEVPGAKYAGAASCRECHEEEFTDWTKSDHHRAMEPATEETVHGDFNDVEFEHFGRMWKFFRKGEEFWVNAEDENGERKDFKIDYTFGFEPLQQYLIPFSGGRYQALQVCWDSRPKEKGGQRWYHLYPEEEIPPDDILHWTGIHFNWNYMCADCHSTDLHKNYDPAKGEYSTVWAEMNVSCEACHGPASEHLKWAATYSELEKKEGASPDSEEARALLGAYPGNKGLQVNLKEPVEAAWGIDPETLKPFRTSPLNSSVQVDTCARCHAHRQLLEPNYVAGQSFLDTHAPSLLSDQLYHHDGQVDEEDYVYGSFLQSKMHHSGVRCTDCHHPHTMKPLAPGNALCIRCHIPTKYDTPEHHHHEVGSTGASCVECHMPTKTYMGVDARRDHSLRIPRPDLSKKLNAPNACNQCHTDKDTDWAVNAFHEWWGKGPRDAHYGEIFHAARSGEGGALPRLIALANDKNRPGIVRATALSEMAMQPLTEMHIQAAAVYLKDEDPLIRAEAVALMERLPAVERLRMLEASLGDKSRAVRVEAARVLAAATGLMNVSQRQAFDTVAEEFKTRQAALSDRAAGYLRLALFYQDMGKFSEAEAAYRKAFEIEPDNVPTRVNLGELLIQQQRFDEAEAVYRDAVASAKMDGNIGVAHDAFARFLIRMKRYEEGIAELKEAARLLPEDPRVQYFMGVAMNSTGSLDEALPYLRKATELAPNHVEYIMGLIAICRDGGRFDEAIMAAKKLQRINPSDPQPGMLIQELQLMQQQRKQ